MDLVSSFTNEVVRKSLDGLSQRHVAVASNLANVDTPGYRKKNVSFEAQLDAAIAVQRKLGTQQASNDRPLPMKATQRGHVATGPVINSLEDVQPQVEESDELIYRNDQNAVDVETEMVALAKNTQRYVALTNVQGRLLRGTRGVIANTEG